MWTRQNTHECKHSHSYMRTAENEARHRDILVSFHSGLIYRHVSESFETRWEQVASVEDETNVPFTLSFLSCLALSRRECKPGITFSNTGHSHRVCTDVSFSTPHLQHAKSLLSSSCVACTADWYTQLGALPAFCDISCPVYLWIEHTYQLVPPDTVGWSHTLQRLPILSVFYGYTKVVFWIYKNVFMNLRKWHCAFKFALYNKIWKNFWKEEERKSG